MGQWLCEVSDELLNGDRRGEWDSGTMGQWLCEVSDELLNGDRRGEWDSGTVGEWDSGCVRLVMSC